MTKERVITLGSGESINVKAAEYTSRLGLDVASPPRRTLKQQRVLRGLRLFIMLNGPAIGFLPSGDSLELLWNNTHGEIEKLIKTLRRAGISRSTVERETATVLRGPSDNGLPEDIALAAAYSFTRFLKEVKETARTTPQKR